MTDPRQSVSFWEDEEERFYLKREDIEGSDTIPQLREWDEQLQLTNDQILAQLDARRACGTDDEDWRFACSLVLEKIGHGRAHIKRRLRQLGHEPNSYGERIADLQRKLQMAQARGAFGDHLHDLLKEELGFERSDDFAERARARLSAKHIPLLPSTRTEEA